MQQQFIDLMTNFNKTYFDASKELMAINRTAFEKVSQKSIAMMADSMEFGLKQFESAKNFKDINEMPEVINAYSEDTQKISEKMMSDVKETMEIISETNDAYGAWLKRGLDTAANNLKPVSLKSAA